MENETTSFLIRAGLEAYVKVFRDNDIQYSHLATLPENVSVFQELVPKAGHRLTFIQALQNINRQADNDTPPSRSQPSSSFGSPMQIFNLAVNENGETAIESVQEIGDQILQFENVPIHAADTDCNVIRNIAKESLDGLMVLASLSKKRQFDQAHRIKLAKLIIHHEFDLDPQKHISAHRLSFLANCVHKEFGEDPEIWYNPCKRHNGATSLPSGKLYDQYTTITKELRKYGLRDLRRGVKRPAEDPLQILNSQFLDTLPPCSLSVEKISLRMEYLRSEINDWETITQYWKDTVNYRYASLTTGGNARISEYFKKYPALEQEQGFKLLELDFRILFPGAYGRIYTHWDAFVEKVKVQLDLENIKIPDKCSDAEFLHLYAKLFTSVPIKVPNGKTWKPSRKEVLDGFLHHSETDDLHDFWENVDERNRERGLSVQPFAMVIGPSISKIHSYNVVIDKNQFKMNSTKEALAASFYAYHALLSSYPAQSARLWVVLERTLFGMDNTSDSHSQAISRIPEVKRLIYYLKV